MGDAFQLYELLGDALIDVYQFISTFLYSGCRGYTFSIRNFLNNFIFLRQIFHSFQSILVVMPDRQPLSDFIQKVTGQSPAALMQSRDNRAVAALKNVTGLKFEISHLKNRQTGRPETRTKKVRSDHIVVIVVVMVVVMVVVNDQYC